MYADHSKALRDSKDQLGNLKLGKVGQEGEAAVDPVSLMLRASDACRELCNLENLARCETALGPEGQVNHGVDDCVMCRGIVFAGKIRHKRIYFLAVAQFERYTRRKNIQKSRFPEQAMPGKKPQA